MLVTSYLYSDDRSSLLFSSALRVEDSLIPPVKLGEENILFLLDEEMQPSLFFKKKYIHTFCDLIGQIALPSKPDKDFLEKIATIANYLCHGTTFVCILDSVKQKKKGLEFLSSNKTKGIKRRVSLSSLDTSCEISTSSESSL